MWSFIFYAIQEWRMQQAKSKAALAGIDRNGQGEYLARHRAWKEARKQYRTAGGKRQ